MKDYLIDTHAHIDMLEETPSAVTSDMAEYGVKKAIIPAVEEKTSDIVIKIAEENENIYSMVGLFPSEAKTWNEEVKENILRRAENSKVVAVGEIGLDYYWDKSFNNLQKEIFIEQI